MSMIDPLGAFLPGDRLRLEGAAKGPLSGLTFAAKDIFDVAGHVTGCGNPDWAASHEPAQRTAPAVQALLDAGATLVGKTITDELAYSLNGQNLHYGTPTNSNAPGRIPGGSSSGSAAAVAGGAVDCALGSDTGGSIRIPASYCGLYGLRPSHGRIPLDGVAPLAPGFDTVGWFAREPGVLRRVGEVLLGERGAEARLPQRLLLAADAFALADAALRDALTPWVQRLEVRLGAAERIAVGDALGGLSGGAECFRLIQGHEAWACHGAWITRAAPRFAPDVAERFAAARAVSDAEAERARALRQAFSDGLAARLMPGSVICLPSAPAVAPLLTTPAADLAEHRQRVLSLTCIAGLARLPQITLPLASVAGSPAGLSLIAPAGADMMLLRFAESFTGPASA